ncbi:MAG: hypothetical protein Q8R47_02500 [Nanoarchaeota archaeon]|nr:hypothetical protein [Nanoarchaeota archaeon]
MTSFKQKLSAMLVLSLFLLSVLPAGLADEGKNMVDVDAEVHLESDAADAEVKTESKTEVESKDNDSETEEEVKVKTKVRDGSLKSSKLVKREVKELKRDLHQARERLEEAKERYKEAKEEQREHRQKVLDLDKAAKRCNPEKRDCATLKMELRTGVKNHLLKSVQVVERSLEKLTKTIEKMEDLSEEEKENALALVADLEAELDAQKAKINSFTDETSKEEIRAAIKDLKELNQKVHKLQRRLVGLLVNAKLQVLVEKQAELHAGMQARIDALAATGADVSELEAILAEFDAKVEELKQDYQTAQQKWMEAKTAEDFDQFNRNLREAQHQVRKDLQDLKKILRDFLHTHKELKEGSEEDENESEKETEKESEDSEEDTAENESEDANDSDDEESEDAEEADHKNESEESDDEAESNTTLEANTSATATA